MSFFSALNPLNWVKGIFDVAKEPLNEWQQRKTKKVEGELALANKIQDQRFELAKLGIILPEAYDLQALKNMNKTWKDEYLMFVWSLPFIGSFIPGVQDHVLEGWRFIAKAPYWYTLGFLGILAATFGLRWLFEKKMKNSSPMKLDVPVISKTEDS